MMPPTDRSSVPLVARPVLSARLKLAAAVACVGLLGVAGCSSKSEGATDADIPAGDFDTCAGADAGPYSPGMTTTSKSGSWIATLASVTTTSSGAPPVDAPAVGLSTFTLSIASAAGGSPSGLSVTAEKPYMPFHRHSAATVPVVMDRGDGTFVISKINFFMHGYFEITLDLRVEPTGGDDAGTPAADAIVLPICVPS
jgi:hypothetical protein